MFRFFVTPFLMLIVTVPALAKSIDVYQAPCNDLWRAVKDTLGKPDRYGIISIDDAAQRASFVVVGRFTPYTQKVELTAKNGSCTAKATIDQVGPENSDWRQFQHRVAKALATLQAAKPKPS
ncbi:hypothetical protein P8935_12290 [Telmatobacter sp. DSM 110680]|uniref:Uncharacterized protein n=1 Tax=Telmatobacter sp. DSM 110680 TaxID=3036704 RepID=A0AAU7DSR4_9BACT